MRIAFLSRKDPFDKQTWSGAFYNMYKQLASVYSVDWIRPLTRNVCESLILKTLSLHASVTRKKLTVINKFYARSAAASVNNQLNGKYDLIYAAACPELLTYLNTNIPIVYFLDATFLQLTQGYPAYTRLTKWNFSHGMEVERIALAKASKIIVTSEWAKQSAIKDFGADPNKFSIIPFGANLQEEPTSEEAYQFITERIQRLHNIKLLFIGKNWERKGGSLALNACKHLITEGIDVQLTVVGSVPPALHSDLVDHVTVIPNLNKNDESDFIKFRKLMEEHHMLILPTRADCTPIVFSEAAAFALPVITTNVGGITDVLRHEHSALILELEDDSGKYAEAIKTISRRADIYEQFSKNSRTLYEQKLNWNTWVQSVLGVFKTAQQKITA